MKKRWLAPILLATLLLAGPVAEDAAAQKGGSSSGRSFSSGRSSPSGRSFSSGRTTPAPRIAPSGKSSTPTTKPGGTIKIPSAPRSTTPSRPSVPPPSSSGRTYTSPGGLTTKGGSASGRSYSDPPRPASPAFDTLAAAEQRKAESRAAYQQATRPRDTYKAPTGTVKKIDATDAGSIRNRLDHDRWVTREDRVRRQFPDYANRPPVIVYNDPYSSWFWYWLLAQDLNRQAYWAYHHRTRMDDARYRELLARNDKLEQRIKEIEAEKLPVDPTWAPPGVVDPDLMYSDEYVDAVFNPQPSPVEPWDPPPPPPVRPSSPEEVTAAIVVVLLIVGFLIWLVFFKRWGSTCVGKA